jgi:gamma-glutamyltranspeptidase / glutathione hydrolase
MRDFHFPGRSPVRSTEAMVATSHPLATYAALNILREGGNAMDAAVCAAAVQAVVEPQSTGIGGDCFALYTAGGTGKVTAFNGSGRAPAKATIDWYRQKGFDRLPETGPHAVTIPGAIDGWCQLIADFGSMTLADILAPAIVYAEKGYVIHDRVAFDWRASQATLAGDEHAARLFLRGGAPYQSGELHVQPELGATLRKIAAEGRSGFYEGEVAEDLVRRLQELGGLHDLSDFAATRGDYVDPISISYRGYDVFQLPPNNQGITALMMLNILSGYDLSALDPNGAERLHLALEAGRLAYHNRDRHVADQGVVDVPVEPMLSKAYADHMRGMISPEKAMKDLPPMHLPDSDTVYISVVDKDRNAISFINSTYYAFGSGVVGPQSGVILQNRGTSFSLDPAHPNALAPMKRPMHTIMPGMLMKDGKVAAPYGVMGGGYQPFGHVNLLTNIIDYGMDPQAALDAARVFYQDGVVEAERSVSPAARVGLQRKGHRIIDADEPLGGGQIVMVDWEKGTLTGASDPRKDGCALGF